MGLIPLKCQAVCFQNLLFTDSADFPQDFINKTKVTHIHIQSDFVQLLNPWRTQSPLDCWLPNKHQKWACLHAHFKWSEYDTIIWWFKFPPPITCFYMGAWLVYPEGYAVRFTHSKYETLSVVQADGFSQHFNSMVMFLAVNHIHTPTARPFQQ